MALNRGDEAPDFELENHHRQPVRLSNFRGVTNVILAFHPLAWTPVCAGELCALEANRARLADLDTQVLGISIDSSATKAAWAKSLGGFSFDLLSDFYPHGAVAEQYGVLRPEGFAERAVFVVDKTGRIAFARVYGIPEQPDLTEVMAALEALPSRT